MKQLTILSLCFILGALFIKHEIYGDLKNIARNIYYKTIATTNNSTPPIISIIIDDKSWDKIKKTRNSALKNTVYFTNNKDYVPAKYIFNEDTIQGKLRLKGALEDHWNDDKKWSFRIKLDSNKTILQFNKFSIQHPKTRFYLNEWFALKVFEQEEIISVDYQFVSISINGEDFGIYALEEHFNKNLIEKSGYRSGPILRFKGNEKRSKLQQMSLLNIENPELGSFTTSPIEGYNIKKENKALFKKAYSLLAQFREGDIATHNIFDLKKMATYLALKDLFGSMEVDHNDLRVYYNPVTSKLEPIGFDTHCSHEPINHLVSSIDKGIERLYNKREDEFPNFVSLLFNDPLFSKEYVQQLVRISKSNYLDEITKPIQAGLTLQQNILESEYSYLAKVNFNSFKKNQAFINSILDASTHIQANRINKGNRSVKIEFANTQALPLMITGLSYEGKHYPLQSPFYVKGKSISGQLIFYDVNFTIDQEEFKTKKLLVTYNVIGLVKEHTASVSKFEHIKESYVADDLLSMEANYSNFPFITEQNDTLYFKKQKSVISENLIIPANKIVVIQPNSTIDLINSAKIVSYSPLLISSSTILSSDKTGQGIIVLNTNNSNYSSAINNTQFSALQNLQHNRWSVPASITFYQSDVVISDCTFSENIVGDDYLNIFRSSFKVNNSTFLNTLSDAIDIDFSKGSITNCTFNNCGNDAIDASGSEIEINNIVANNIEDKVISAGEKSMLSCYSINITNAEIAFTSKDNSILTVSNSSVSDCGVVYVAFKKKYKYKSAKIRANNVKHQNIKEIYLIENGSELTIDNKIIEPNQNSIKGILYGVKYGKSSKKAIVEQ